MKPVPEIDTPVVMAPATIFVEPNVMAGVPRTVSVVCAELPAASITVTLSVPGACVADTTNPTVLYKLPVAPVTTVDCTIAVGGVVAVFCHNVNA